MELLGIFGATAAWTLLLVAPIALALALVDSAAVPSRRPPSAPHDAGGARGRSADTKRDAPEGQSQRTVRPAADGCACAG